MKIDAGNGITLLEAEEVHLPVVIQKNETYVRERFWTKLRRFAGHVPFSEELVSSYFCAIDSSTPVRVKAILFAALAYFVLPTDLLPDFIAGFGFTDDATVMATAIGIVGGHIKDRHRQKARTVLFRPEPQAD
jgi:uncharacterized membrane protein YkvA (DUF1232 family)